jgi:hypothetical protein
MTQINFLDDSLLPSIRVNGRYAVSCKRITEFRKVRAGHFEGIANGRAFHIEGGRPAGGSSRDWFVDWDEIFKGLHCTSLVEALRNIENA